MIDIYNLTDVKHSLRRPSVAWVILAGVVGGILATLPMTAVAVSVGTLALLLLAAITPLAACVVLLVLAPLRTLMATEAAVRLPLDIGQMALLGLFATYGIYRIARKQSLLTLRSSPVFLPVFIFLLTTFPSALTAQSLGAWISEWLKWVQILILILLVINFASNGRWEWLILGLTLSGVANSLVGLYEFLGGSGAEHLLINDRFFRAFGTFGQPNPFGGFMGLLAPLSLMAAFGYGIRAWQRWRDGKQLIGTPFAALLFYLLSSALLIMGLFISWSRGAWLGFVTSVAIMLFAFPRRVWQSLLFVGVLLAVMAILWFSSWFPISVANRISSAAAEFIAFEDVRGVDITPENYPVVERLAHWQAAWNMIRSEPWVGVGFGNYEVVYPEYRLINWHFPLGHAHNYYLNIWAEAGIIGLFGYGSLWVGMLWHTWQVRKHPDILSRSIAIGLLGTWTYLAVHSIFDNLYVNNLFLHLGMMMGILAELHKQTWKPFLWGKN